jgi:hypothetical protein
MRLQELTGQIGQALAQEDLDRCAILLAERAQLLPRLPDPLTLADQAEAAQYRRLLATLKQADTRLQQQARDCRERVARELAAFRCRTARPTRRGRTLCLDRRA